MLKLKKYNEFLFESDVQTVEQTEANVEIVDKLFIELKNVVLKKIEQNKKLISDYYNKMTKDGYEINTTDDFYTYGRYEGQSNENIKNRTMTFVIRFNEPTESGLTFNVVSSLDLPDLKDIRANEIEIVKKGKESPNKLERGYINGKYVVKNKDKINILKPKEEQSNSQNNKNIVILDPKVGNVYLYDNENDEIEVFCGLNNKGELLAINVDGSKESPFDKKRILKDKGNLLNYIKKSNSTKKLYRKYKDLITKYENLKDNKKILNPVSDDIIIEVKGSLPKTKEDYIDDIKGENNIDLLNDLLKEINNSTILKSIDKKTLSNQITYKINSLNNTK